MARAGSKKKTNRTDRVSTTIKRLKRHCATAGSTANLRGRDADTYYQRFGRRRRRSAWSKRNIEIAERLIAAGRMHPAGIAELESARADGRKASRLTARALPSIEVPAVPDGLIPLEEVVAIQGPGPALRPSRLRLP